METAALKLGVTTDYLLRIHDKYLLVDTGYAHEWGAFSKGLAALGVGIGDISHILLTHHHDDHSGLVAEVTRRNPDIRVVVSSRSVPLLSTGHNDRSQGGAYLNRAVWALLWLRAKVDSRWSQTFPPYTYRPQDIVVEGETALGDIGVNLPGRILETPGHTVDSIAMVFDDGDCVVGDAAANFLRLLGTKYCVIYVEDLDDYYGSWRKLLSAGARRILPAHGKPFGAERLAEYLNRNRSDRLVSLR